MSVLFKAQSVSRFAMSAAMAMGVLALGSARTEAATLGFSCITNNAASSCAIGQSQLTAELTDLGNNQVEFWFQNTGASNSSVTQIYFDQPNPTVMGLSSMTGSNGVSFRTLSPPLNLPGGNGINFSATNGVGSRPPVSPNGINPGEWLKLVFTLNSGSTFASLLTNLATGDLRIGMHVQSIGQWGNSESFVNQPPTVVPEPASLILLGTGLAAAAARRRRKQGAASPAQQ
jgi:PEP-CTERM motif